MQTERTVAIQQPPTPAIPAEDRLAIAQAIILVAVAFLAPGITETQSLALTGLAAVIGAALSNSGAKRRVSRNDRVAVENQGILDLHARLEELDVAKEELRGQDPD